MQVHWRYIAISLIDLGRPVLSFRARDSIGMAEAKSENLILTPASAHQEITLRLIFSRPTFNRARNVENWCLLFTEQSTLDKKQSRQP
jgi:hypothetical protein